MPGRLYNRSGCVRVTVLSASGCVCRVWSCLAVFGCAHCVIVGYCAMRYGRVMAPAWGIAWWSAVEGVHGNRCGYRRD
jgi:hypothetical protein